MNAVRIVMTLAALLLFGQSVSASQGQGLNRGQWVLLGTRTIAPAATADTFPVTTTLGPFDHVYLKVEGAQVTIVDLRITYKSGPPDVIAIRAAIPAGSSTTSMDLKGGDREITSIALTFQPRTAGAPATVQVYAQR